MVRLRNSGRLRGVGADAFDHGAHAIGALRGQVLFEAEFAKKAMRIGSEDFLSGSVGIKRERNSQKAAHQMRIAVAAVVKRLLARCVRARIQLQPDLADATAHLVGVIVSGLAQRFERTPEFENIAVAILPVVQEGEIAANRVKACQRGVLRTLLPPPISSCSP